jgi:hypothetical protein
MRLTSRLILRLTQTNARCRRKRGAHRLHSSGAPPNEPEIAGVVEYALELYESVRNGSKFLDARTLTAAQGLESRDVVEIQ